MIRISKIRIAASLATLAILVPAAAFAAPDIGMGYAADIGLSGVDIRTIIAGIIRSLLGLLGIYLVVRIMQGGFMYMTHGGSEEARTEAIGIIKGAIIGMMIIMMSSSIAGFVVNAVANASGMYLG